ncbi:MAG TPA: ABC transporter ATP-binding protein [Spirochaetota bacterium]|jgi:phospholipid/cholesterol/gamma-HCH transport system ATP-binding protein|nr:ABC transporter ATP-binding protein [Spirochaetota bacterium]HOK92322.1 ABC transporter ATP-binding protein [Spirochaetota bacterium]HOQ11111.1 ABC transporter ATP-binding protein [Spirochaetota bacterium]HPP93882.1 ABC transporter ATP-binding protein [Spirochaetota bacterium]HPX91689.1 ABC transporter ATP-binding protein [Spirochaetota bacterium]
MIELRNICKRFGSKIVLDDVSLKIEDGETFVIIGQSGVGKTTILRAIAGFFNPDSGEVLIDGIHMDRATSRVKANLREKMGFLFQSGALINWLSVRENVALPLVEHRIGTKEEIDRIVDEKLELLQLTDAAEKMPSDISGGMKKRVGLARAIVRNPRIILYDEPTSGLDPVMSAKIDELIIKMKNELKVTSIVVTHDMESAYRIADRIAMIYKGSVLQCGTPEEIKNTTNPFVRQFIEGRLHGPIEV